MHAAQLTQWGTAPKYTIVDDAPEPEAESDLVRIKVLATSIHGVVRMLESGAFQVAKMPHIPGIDGVGLTSDNKVVYFSSVMSWGNAFAEYVTVPKMFVTPIPDGVDKIHVAGFLNSVTASWMAFSVRMEPAPPTDFTVVILGVTTSAGSMAVQVARKFGAGKVIGVGRNPTSLEKVKGLDQKIVLNTDNVVDTDYSSIADSVDVILDFLYGPPAEHLLASLNTPRPIQYFHTGGMGTDKLNIDGAVLRYKDYTIRGVAPGSYPMMLLGRETPKMIEALRDLEPLPFRTAKLADVEKEWNADGDKLILIP